MEAMKKTTPGPEVPASYEAAVQELEQLVTRMESNQLPLQDLLMGYQRGQYLLEFCRGRLDEVEQHLQRLDGEASDPKGPNA